MRKGVVWRAMMMVSVAVVTLLGVGAAPAAAHNVTVRLTTSGGTLMGSAAVSGGHTVLNVCDPRRDGVIVRAHYYLANSLGTTRTIEIPDMAGCVRRTVTSSSNPIAYVRVCSRGGYSNCTAAVKV